MLLLKAMLIVLLNIQSTLGTLVVTTKNATTFAAICTSAPTWNLNMCNLTCNACMPTDHNKCQSCESGLSLTSDNYCQLITNPDTYYYTNLLSTNPLYPKDVTLFGLSGTANKALSYDSIVRICSQNLYNF